MVENIELPRWLGSYLNRDGLQKIEAAVHAAEKETSGEIVPILVRRSVAVALVPLIMGLLGVLIALSVLDSLGGAGLEMRERLIAIALSALVGWALGRLHRVQRWVIPRFEQEAAVNKRALLEFYQAELRKTKGGTGILLFVSLLEHRAIVLADEGIAQHCKPEDFQDVVRELIAGAKDKDLASGFARAIEKCKRILAPHFPRQSDDTNELRDHLIICED